MPSKLQRPLRLRMPSGRCSQGPADDDPPPPYEPPPYCLHGNSFAPLFYSAHPPPSRPVLAQPTSRDQTGTATAPSLDDRHLDDLSTATAQEITHEAELSGIPNNKLTKQCRDEHSCLCHVQCGALRDPLPERLPMAHVKGKCCVCEMSLRGLSPI